MGAKLYPLNKCHNVNEILYSFSKCKSNVSIYFDLDKSSVLFWFTGTVMNMDFPSYRSAYISSTISSRTIWTFTRAALHGTTQTPRSHLKSIFFSYLRNYIQCLKRILLSNVESNREETWTTWYCGKDKEDALKRIEVETNLLEITDYMHKQFVRCFLMFIRPQNNNIATGTGVCVWVCAYTWICIYVFRPAVCHV